MLTLDDKVLDNKMKWWDIAIQCWKQDKISYILFILLYISYILGHKSPLSNFISILQNILVSFFHLSFSLMCQSWDWEHPRNFYFNDPFPPKHTHRVELYRCQQCKGRWEWALRTVSLWAAFIVTLQGHRVTTCHQHTRRLIPSIRGQISRGYSLIVQYECSCEKIAL